MSNSLWPHGLQCTRHFCPLLFSRVCSDSCPLNLWCYLSISFSNAPLSFCFQSFPVSTLLYRSQPCGQGACITQWSYENKTWSTGWGNGNALQYSCLENSMNSMKRQKDTITGRWPPQKRPKGVQYATGEEWRTITNSSRNNEADGPKQKQCSFTDVSGGESKVQCCKEQYCTGTWNVRSVNQDKSALVKEEMTRVNINILGISELKWMGKGEFNSDDHYIYYCGQESLRRNGVALIVNKKV